MMCGPGPADHCSSCPWAQRWFVDGHGAVSGQSEFFPGTSSRLSVVGEATGVNLPWHLEEASLQEEITKPSRDTHRGHADRKHPDDVIRVL